MISCFCSLEDTRPEAMEYGITPVLYIQRRRFILNSLFREGMTLTRKDIQDSRKTIQFPSIESSYLKHFLSHEEQSKEEFLSSK